MKRKENKDLMMQMLRDGVPYRSNRLQGDLLTQIRTGH